MITATTASMATFLNFGFSPELFSSMFLRCYNRLKLQLERFIALLHKNHPVYRTNSGRTVSRRVKNSLHFGFFARIYRLANHGYCPQAMSRHAKRSEFFSTVAKRGYGAHARSVQFGNRNSSAAFVLQFEHMAYFSGRHGYSAEIKRIFGCHETAATPATGCCR